MLHLDPSSVVGQHLSRSPRHTKLTPCPHATPEPVCRPQARADINRNRLVSPQIPKINRRLVMARSAVRSYQGQPSHRLTTANYELISRLSGIWAVPIIGGAPWGQKSDRHDEMVRIETRELRWRQLLSLGETGIVSARWTALIR